MPSAARVSATPRIIYIHAVLSHLFCYAPTTTLTQAINRIQPRLGSNGVDTTFTGRARFAVPIYSFKVSQVKKPLIGETKPSLVKAQITIDLSPFNGQVRQEWEMLREHDVLFLTTVNATVSAAEGRNRNKPVYLRKDQREHGERSWEELNREELGVKYVRGAEVCYEYTFSFIACNSLPHSRVLAFDARTPSPHTHSYLLGVFLDPKCS